MAKKEFNAEKAKAFVGELRKTFNKHAKVFEQADKHLADNDYEAFTELYTSQSKEDLAEMAQAQHLKINETFGLVKTRSDNLMQILRDVSSCKDFVEFGNLQKKARTILMAQDMVDSGMSPDEVTKKLETAINGEKNIITH